MSLFTRRKLEAPAEQRGDFVWPFPGVMYEQPSWSGVSVNVKNSLRSMAVLACVRVLKTAVANLPVDAVRLQGGAHVPVASTPRVVARPSGRVSRRAWVAQMMDGLLTAGNAYGVVVAVDGVGRPTQVETVAATDVVWRETDGVEAPFLKGKPVDVWPVGDLIHVPASAFLRSGSRVADSPVDLAKQSIGTGLAAEEFGAKFFRDGATPSAIIKSKTSLTETQATAIKTAAKRALSGSRDPAVFGADLDFEQLSVKPNESQFIDLIRFEVEQVCRAFGVPPTMAYAAISGQNITYSNATQQDMQFLKFSVQSWLLDLEDAWSSWLTAPVVVKFNVDALLRMDTVSRYGVHEVALRNRLRSVNEVRALEDLPPFSDPVFNEPGVPGGTTPAGGDPQNAPSAN